MIKRFLVVLCLTAVASVSLVGCSNKNASESAKKKDETKTEATVEPTEEVKKETATNGEITEVTDEMKKDIEKIKEFLFYHCSISSDFSRSEDFWTFIYTNWSMFADDFKREYKYITNQKNPDGTLDGTLDGIELSEKLVNYTASVVLQDLNLMPELPTGEYSYAFKHNEDKKTYTLLN